MTLRRVLDHPFGIVLPDGRLCASGFSRLPLNAPYLNDGHRLPYLLSRQHNHLRVITIANASKSIKHTTNQFIQVGSLRISMLLVDWCCDTKRYLDPNRTLPYFCA